MNGYTREAAEGVVIIARMVAPEGKREELLELLNEIVAGMAEHEPDGPLTTVFHVSNTDPNAVVEYSHFPSRESFEHHRANYTRVPIYAEYRQRLDALLARPIEALEVATPAFKYVRTAS